MSFTLDFILLLLLFVIPGFVFKRLYFYGEFSKQFNTKEPLYKSIFYSIIPGIIFQIAGFYLYKLFRNTDFCINDVINIGKDLYTSKESLYGARTLNFVKGEIDYFFIHQFNINVLAASSGFLLSRIVRLTKLDINSKVFRYRNPWYYILSGEIQNFKKFKAGFKIGILKTNSNPFKYYPPKADILLKGANGESALYSGFIIDYELDSNNIQNLDKLYLAGATRYRDKRDKDEAEGFTVVGSRTEVPINGDVFVLDAANIININLTFIPPPDDIVEQNKSKKEIRIQKFYRFIFNLNIFLTLPIVIDILFAKGYLTKIILPEFISTAISESHFFMRLLFAMFANQLLSIFMPEEENNEATNHKRYRFTRAIFITKLVVIVVLWLIIYLVKFN